MKETKLRIKRSNTDRTDKVLLIIPRLLEY